MPTLNEHAREAWGSAWTWERVYGLWSRFAGDLILDLASLHATIQIHDPDDPDRGERYVTWVRRGDVDELTLKLQRHFNRCPGSQVPDSAFGGLRKGEVDTAAFLKNVQGNRKAAAAILIAASLCSRLNTYYPRDNWPAYWQVRHVADVAIAQCLSFDSAFGWDWQARCVLPYLARDYESTLIDVEDVIRSIVVEHTALLQNWTVTEIVFATKPDRSVDAQLKDEAREDERRHLQWKADHERALAQEAAEEKAKRAKHPRYEAWPTLTKDELERLVWSMPTTQVADLFGVSDAAVGKRCKAVGINKPARGFWNRVASGAIADPMGVAPSSERPNRGRNQARQDARR